MKFVYQNAKWSSWGFAACSFEFTLNCCAHERFEEIGSGFVTSLFCFVNGQYFREGYTLVDTAYR